MSKRKNVVVKTLCLLLGIYLLNSESARIYAMEDVGEKIETALEESQPQQYEMNIILNDLLIKWWKWPSNASDELDGPFDEPLGEYSPEALREYTDRELEVKIEYGYGRLWEGDAEQFIQSVRIYENGEVISCSFHVWRYEWVDGGGAKLKYPRVEEKWWKPESD